MKICPNCNSQIKDETKFCPKCGAAVDAPEFAGQNVSASSANPLVAGNTALGVVRESVKSPLFLVATIAISISLILSFSTLISGYQFFEATGHLARKVMSVRQVREIVDIVNTVLMVFGLLALIPSVITAVGLWMTYYSAIGKNGDTISTGGLTMIKVIAIIRVVFAFVYALITTAAFAFVFTNSSKVLEVLSEVVHEYAYRYYEYFENTKGIFVAVLAVAFVMLLAVHTLLIVYWLRVISTLNTVKNTINTGVASAKVSGFVAVICFIAAGFQFIGIFSSDGAAAVFSSILSITALVCFGVLIFRYKERMRQLNTPSVGVNI